MKLVRTIAFVCLLLLFGATMAADGFADEKVDSTWAWKKWKSIEGAIFIRELDGPEDILEKAEIIEDRADDLVTEKKRLESEIKASEKKLTTFRSQQQMLKELDEIKLGSDPQTRQRLYDLAERIQREEKLFLLRKESAGELEKEIARMQKLSAEYHKKASDLKAREGGGQ